MIVSASVIDLPLFLCYSQKFLKKLLFFRGFMDVKRICAEVLDGIRPDKKRVADVLYVVKPFLKSISDNLKSLKLSAKVVLGGSFAKGTWLSGDFDVDVFVKFAMKYKDDDLSGLLEQVLKPFGPERVHGSRDYFWVRKGGIKFEIVPVLAISRPEQAQNVTDFSPLHVAWVNENGAGLKDDIRLLKQFCKANGVYGAESFIRGFSGHVVDILVIHFNGFLNLLKAASSWKTNKKIVIDHYNKYKGRALFFLNKSKTQSPLVVVDPVQPDRNAAAALSLEKLRVFLKAVRGFLKRPSEEFFVLHKPDFNKLSKKGHLFVVDVKTLDAKPDVAGAKFVRAFEFVKKQLGDFGVVDSGWEWDEKSKGLWWFVLKQDELPVFFELKGPPVNLKDSVVAFKKKHKSVFVRNGRLFAKVKRDLTSAFDVLLQALGSDFVVGRVRSAKVGLV
ncbi:MAG TPA: CCA tRNA nucleotidyltransferase [Candidatus Woesearchaeota archaeon]|nr:CCA tRNA nucleotidyltransferase [Candidatus Woesearchaeota archaeon]